MLVSSAWHTALMMAGAGIGPRSAHAQELSPRVELQESGVGVLLQAVSPVDERVVWISGHGGTWLRTLDGGTTWTGGTVPGADTPALPQGIFVLPEALPHAPRGPTPA